MKKKFLSLLLTAALITGLFTGCGASSKDESIQEVPREEAMAETGLASNGSLQDTAMISDQKLIKRVRIYAETENLQTLLAGLDDRIRELGGYIEYRNIENGSHYEEYRYRSASLTVRIPAERLGEFTDHVENSANVVSINQSQENVTLQYADTESRVLALETEQSRLLELMDQAQTMTELLEIEERLTEVRYELESVASQLKILANQVTYATVEITVDQVVRYTQVEEQTVWQRIGTGFRENLQDLGEGLTDFFVWFVTYLPQIILFAALVTGIVLLGRRSSRKRRDRKMRGKPYSETPPEQTPEQKP